MTIASEITKLNTNLEAAYTAVDSKGGTLPSAQNFDNLATAIASIPSKGKYNIGDRIYPDNSNTSIGTVYCFFKDNNDIEYAIVCLDCSYRIRGGNWLSDIVLVTNLPAFSDSNNVSIYNTQSATFNCNMILAMSPTYTSSSVNHCRQYSFIIDGVTYYGQLPNIYELACLYANRSIIYNNDPTDSGSGYTSLKDGFSERYWSSSQHSQNNGYGISNTGQVLGMYKTTSYYCVAPILEIPNY